MRIVCEQAHGAVSRGELCGFKRKARKMSALRRQANSLRATLTRREVWFRIIIVFMAIWLVLGIVRIPVFDAFSIEYRFWSKILPRKWLSYIVLACYYPLVFVVFLVLCHFPNWFVVVALGICLGIIQPPVPSRYGSARFRRILSYEQLYDIYINQTDFWESKIEQRKNSSRK